MNQLRNVLTGLVAVPFILVLASSGCATKKYVTQQVTPVSQKVDTLASQTNEKFAKTDEKIAGVAATEVRDVSQINERISSTEMKLGLASTAAQQAQSTASSAKSEAEANASKIAANSQAVATLRSGVADAFNYKLVEKADVTFAVNRFSLTPEAKAALDLLASKVQTLPRVVVEVVGFTDQSGPQDYNLTLSRRRAEAVERYLVTQKVPLRVIHTAGMGEEAVPPGLEADLTVIDPNPSQAELNRLARRVRIQIFGAGNIVQPQVSSAGGGQK